MIVPLYRGEIYLDKIIKMFNENIEYSKNNGLLVNAELIFVNDYAQEKVQLQKIYNTNNIFVFNNGRNVGIHQTRINGLKKSIGKYILFLDQDDVISSDFFYHSLSHIKGNDVIVLNGYDELYNGTRKKIYNTYADVKILLTPKSFFTDFCHIESPGHCLICRNSIPQEWIKIVLKNNCSDDLYLWILMSSLRKNFVFFNRCCYIHSYTGSNLSLDLFKREKSNRELYGLLNSIDYVSKLDINLFGIYRGIGENKEYHVIYMFIFYFFRAKYKILNMLNNKELNDGV